MLQNGPDPHLHLRRNFPPMPALLAALLLAGCASGPDYKAPPLTANQAFRTAPALAGFNAQVSKGGAPTAPLSAWWSGFDDAKLSVIVQRVLAQNLDLDGALARIEQARAAARAAGARQLPEGSATAAALRQRQSTLSPEGRLARGAPGYERDQSVYSLGLGASWELDLAGGLRRGSEEATAQAQAAEADHLGVRVSVAAEAADAYFRVRGAQARIALARSQLKANADLFDLVSLRQAEGLSASRETAQAAARLAQVKATIPPLVAERDIELNRLDVLMGAQPGTYATELDGPAAPARLPTIAQSGSPGELMRRRPDVIAAERRLAASNAAIGVASADYYPAVSLSALAGVVSLGSGGLLTAAAFQPQAGLGLRWRLFDFGRIDADVAGAKGRHAEALAAYRKAMLRATEDVENAVVSLVQLQARRGDLDEQVSAQSRSRAAAQEAYKDGALSLYEVIEEDRQLLAARDQLAEADAGLARAVVALFRALGGGW
ncbi:MAG: efflux transporter outer membrane subunit [Massilia sp.]